MTRWARFKDWADDWQSELTVCAIAAAPFVLLAVAGALIGEVGGADGRHVCYVTAVEDRVNVTWNSTVVYVKSNPESTQEDKYCVTDAALRTKLDDAAARRVPVVIHYRNGLILWRWECNGGDSVIVGVEEADDLLDPSRRRK